MSKRVHFYVDVIVSMRRVSTAAHRTADEVRTVGFIHPPVPVEIVDGPQVLEPGCEARVRLAVVATDRVGPGLIEKGDVCWIGDGRENGPHGHATVVRATPIGADPGDPSSWRQVRRSELEVEPLSDSTVECPTCANVFQLHDRWQWTGVRHRPCGQRLRLRGVERQVEPVWCLAGNMIEERPYGRGGLETRKGSKHFSPGTKLYCYPPLWGDGYEQVRVIGRHRGSPHMVSMIVRGEWIVNRRARLVYAPAIVDRLSGYWDGTDDSRRRAEALAQGASRDGERA